jgi:hypothetical protein
MTEEKKARTIVDETGAMTHVFYTDGSHSEADIQDAADRTGWSVEKIKAILG